MFASIESLTNLNSTSHHHQENLIVKLNLQSCKLVRKKQVNRAISLLNKAIYSLDHDKDLFYSNQKRKLLKAITLNNLGCTIAKSASNGNSMTSKYNNALEHFTRALKIEVKHSAYVSNPAGTHLNICSMLSKLKRHGEAMEHAQCALTLIKNGNSPAITTDGAGQKSSVLALGHHNLAVEQEILGHYRASLNSYMAACHSALGGLGEEHKLTKAIHKNANAALLSIEKKLHGKADEKHIMERARKSRILLDSRIPYNKMKARNNNEKENVKNSSNDNNHMGNYLNFIKEENGVILPVPLASLSFLSSSSSSNNNCNNGSRNAMLNHTSSPHTNRSNYSETSSISCESTPSPSSISSRSNNEGSISSLGSGAGDMAKEIAVKHQGKKKRTMTVVLLQPHDLKSFGNKHVKKSTLKNRVFTKSNKNIVITKRRKGKKKTISSATSSSLKINERTMDRNKNTVRRGMRVVNKHQRPISANPRLLKSSRSNNMPYQNKANLIQTAYGQASRMKNRPKSAPMRRLPLANMPKPVSLPSPKKGAWLAKERNKDSKAKKNTNTHASIVPELKLKRKKRTKKKIPVKKRDSSHSDNRGLTCSSANSSLVSGTPNFGRTKIVYEPNFIPSFKYKSKHRTTEKTAESLARPSSAPMHRLKAKSPSKSKDVIGMTLSSGRKYSSPKNSKKVKTTSNKKNNKRTTNYSPHKKTTSFLSTPATLLLSSSPPSSRPPTPKQIEDANAKMAIQQQNRATYNNVLISIIKIQSVMRAFLARREHRRLHTIFINDNWKQIQNENAIKIQSMIRRKLASAVVKQIQRSRNESNGKKRGKTNFVNRFIHSIKKSIFRRGGNSNSNYKNKKSKKKISYSNFSYGKKKEDVCRLYDVNERVSTFSQIPNVAPQVLGKSFMPKDDIRKIVKVQSIARSYMARNRLLVIKKQQQCHEHTMNLIVEKHIKKLSSIKIQSIIRRHSAKQIVKQKRKQIEQREVESAIKIQSITRQKSAKKIVRSKRRLQASRAEILLKLLKRLDHNLCAAYTRCAYETIIQWNEMIKKCRESSSVKIQSHIRKFIAIKTLRAKRKLNATVVIQKHIRATNAKAVVAKRRHVKLIEKQHTASTKIQSIFRRNQGIDIVKKLLILRETQELEKLQTKATIKIQSTLRKHLAIKERNRRFRKRMEKLHKFAVKIQCFQRKHTAMRRVKEMLMIRHKYLINVVVIQSCVRMFLAKLKLDQKKRKMFYDKLDKAFVVIHNHKKKAIVFQLLKQIENIHAENVLSTAAIEIQSFVRMHQSIQKMQVLKNLEEERVAKVVRDNFKKKVVHLQSIARTFIAVKRFALIKQQKQNHEKTMHEIVDKHIQKVCSIKIQATFRRYLAKLLFHKKRTNLLVQKAISIQKYYRRYKCVRDFKVEERVMYNSNLSNVLDFAQEIIDAVRETEDVVSNIERDLLGIDTNGIHAGGSVKTWEMLEKILFQTRLKMMRKRHSKAH